MSSTVSVPAVSEDTDMESEATAVEAVVEGAEGEEASAAVSAAVGGAAAMEHKEEVKAEVEELFDLNSFAESLNNSVEEDSLKTEGAKTFQEKYSAFIDDAIAEVRSWSEVKRSQLLDSSEQRFSTAMPLEKVHATTIAMIGCGGLGNWIWRVLLGMGFQQLVVYDDDVVGVENIGPQAHNVIDIDLPKVEAIRRSALLFRGVVLNVRKKRVFSPGDIEEDLGYMPDIIIGATDSALFRNIFIGSLFGNREILEKYSKDLIFKNSFSKKPRLFIDLRMSLGDWNCFAIPVQALHTPWDYGDAAVRSRGQLISDYLKVAIFSPEEAVHEPCTARAITYTGANVASYVGAFLHWWVTSGESKIYRTGGLVPVGANGAEEALMVDAEHARYISLKFFGSERPSDGDFNWLYQFSSKDFLAETMTDRQVEAVNNTLELEQARQMLVANLNSIDFIPEKSRPFRILNRATAREYVQMLEYSSEHNNDVYEGNCGPTEPLFFGTSIWLTGSGIYLVFGGSRITDQMRFCSHMINLETGVASFYDSADSIEPIDLMEQNSERPLRMFKRFKGPKCYAYKILSETNSAGALEHMYIFLQFYARVRNYIQNCSQSNIYAVLPTSDFDFIISKKDNKIVTGIIRFSTKDEINKGAHAYTLQKATTRDVMVIKDFRFTPRNIKLSRHSGNAFHYRVVSDGDVYDEVVEKLHGGSPVAAEAPRQPEDAAATPLANSAVPGIHILEPAQQRQKHIAELEDYELFIVDNKVYCKIGRLSEYIFEVIGESDTVEHIIGNVEVTHIGCLEMNELNRHFADFDNDDDDDDDDDDNDDDFDEDDEDDDDDDDDSDRISEYHRHVGDALEAIKASMGHSNA